jgi:hypothetical protein
MNSTNKLATLSILILSGLCLQFDFRSAKCLADIFTRHAEQLHPSRHDPYIESLRQILTQESSALHYESLKESRFVSEAHLLLNFYDSLNENTRSEIEGCKIDTSRTLSRCEDKYGKGNCVALNPIAYRRKCPSELFSVLHHNAYCYRACPSKFIELGNRCQKPEAISLTPFPAKSDCETVSGHKCEPHSSGLWLQECPESFERVLDFFCVPKCPLGWAEDRDYCHKTHKFELDSPVVFNLLDLINDASH